ncbi:MAG: hypothetical protein M3Q19_01090 [Pseudomonadota bacterium]|nr:hypothetical protein [Pseudomonadota bacterium]
MILATILWFNFFQDSSSEAFAQRSLDLIDPRPARSILIIGNSRTYYNEMPTMLRQIADSADSPAKFQIETNAKPGFTFSRHWADGRTKRLLREGWDEVILQGASAELNDEPSKESFLAHGRKLAGIAKVKGGVPRLVVNWAYDPSLYPAGARRDLHLEWIRSGHAQLAEETEMRRINLAGLWEAVRLSQPSIRLTTDGNHPTLAGSYLYALALYAHLSNSPARDVTYAPAELDPSDAEALRSAVDSFPLLMS